MGFCKEPESISQNMIDARELDVIGSRMSAYQFAPTAKNMAGGKYNLEGLATHFIPFSKIGDVFDKIKNPDPSVKKIVILFEE
jgi:L-gulonate 5-dehydrogenase